MKTLYQRITTGLTAAALIVAQVIMPAQVAFATNQGPSEAGGTEQQVFCNELGASGKWKAQIGGPSTEHEYPLLDNLNNPVFAHDQQDVSAFDGVCEAQYGGDEDAPVTPVAPIVTAITKCGEYGSVIIADTDAVDYTLTAGDGKQGAYTVTAVAKDGYVIADRAQTVFTGNLGTYSVCPANYIQTSHVVTCGEIKITLRNVSPWWYPVSYSTDGSTPGVSGPNYGPSVNNLGSAPDDQTGTKTITFAEDANGGEVTVKYVVAAGTESDLYRNLPVGTVTSVVVDTDCIPPVVDLCNNIDGIQTEIPKNTERDEEGNCYKKVFVCKYIGTPFVDERLQTGDNPISVSVNSIKDFAGLGSYFNDAQGRSFVLAFDEGQPEPSVDDCGAPVNAPVPTFADATCEAQGTYTIPESEDYFYTVETVLEDEKPIEAGTFFALSPSTVTIRAYLIEDSYSLMSVRNVEPIQTWVHNFPSPENCEPGSGGGNPVTPAATVTPALPAELPVTGGLSSLSAVIIALATAVAAYGAVYFAQSSRRYEQ